MSRIRSYRTRTFGRQYASPQRPHTGAKPPQSKRMRWTQMWAERHCDGSGVRLSIEGQDDARPNRSVGEVVQVLRQWIFGGAPEFERQRDTTHPVALVHQLVFLGALLRREVLTSACAVILPPAWRQHDPHEILW